MGLPFHFRCRAIKPTQTRSVLCRSSLVIPLARKFNITISQVLTIVNYLDCAAGGGVGETSITYWPCPTSRLKLTR